MSRIIVVVAVALAVTLTAAAHAAGAQSAATIVGTVSDASGAALPGATVQVSSQRTARRMPGRMRVRNVVVLSVRFVGFTRFSASIF